MRYQLNKVLTFAAFGLITGLGACGGGGGGDDSDEPTLDLTADLTYDERNDQLNDFSDDVGAIGGTNISNFPTTGAASYAGGLRMGLPTGADSTEDLIGVVDLSVDYGAGEITGDVDNFVNANDVSVPGSLDITGRTVLDNNPTPDGSAVFRGGAEGDLTVNGNVTPIDLDFTSGAFQGASGQYMSAGVSGETTPASGTETFEISGEIFAIRQDGAEED